MVLFILVTLFALLVKILLKVLTTHLLIPLECILKPLQRQNFLLESVSEAPHFQYILYNLNLIIFIVLGA